MDISYIHCQYPHLDQRKVCHSTESYPEIGGGTLSFSHGTLCSKDQTQNYCRAHGLPLSYSPAPAFTNLI